MEDKDLPSLCPNHPDAKIRHEWDREMCVWNGLPRGGGIDKNHHYYCNECGLELCSPEEYEKRIDKSSYATTKDLEDADDSLEKNGYSFETGV